MTILSVVKCSFEYMPVKIFTDQTFTQEVRGTKGLVLVDFWAPWCGPCQQQGPIISELADETVGAVIGKVNVDENQKTASEYGVMSIPTLIIFKDGVPIEQLVGVHQKGVLKKKLEQLAR